jgi:hypothetical protein
MILPSNYLKRALPQRWWPFFHFFTRRVQEHWWYFVNDRRYTWITGEPDEMLNRKSLERYELGEGCFTETYWAERAGGPAGPVLFLVVHGSEIAKFDCYGSEGHYHVATPHPYGLLKALHGRLHFVEKTAEDQVERAIFELRHNSACYLATHARRRVRRTRLDEQRLAAVCAEMRSKMLGDLRRFSQQAAIREVAADSQVAAGKR